MYFIEGQRHCRIRAMHSFLLIGAVIWHATSSEAAAVRNRRLNSPLVCAITDSFEKFTPNFFKAVAEVNNGNLVCSAPSASMVLSMAALGAEGNTEQQLQTVLALSEDKELASVGFRNYIISSKNYKRAGLHLANKVFVRQDLVPYGRFTTLIKIGFRSEVNNLNFRKTDEASRTINEWCSSQTNNGVRDLVKPEDVDPATDVVFANAVYFKGKWADQFDARDTLPNPFFVNSHTKKNVSSMYKYGFYKTGKLEDLKASFIEIPYNKTKGANDEQLSMFIVLPDKVEGLVDLVKNIEKLTVQRLASGEFLDVYLLLPKFKIESTIPLDRVLAKMGATDILSQTAVDLNGITIYPHVRRAKFIHKVVIEVDEGASKPDPPPFAQMLLSEVNLFHVNRPFLGFIASPSSSVIFFSFRYTGPPEAEKLEA